MAEAVLQSLATALGGVANVRVRLPTAKVTSTQHDQNKQRRCSSHVWPTMRLRLGRLPRARPRDPRSGDVCE
eukprot:3825799-Pyramimonas_sp.AAC.1